MFPLLFRRVLGAYTVRNYLNESSLKSDGRRRTIMAALHKKERLRLAYDFNELGLTAMS